MLLDKYVEVKVNSCTVKYYESLGYKIPMKKATKNTLKVTGKEYVYDFSKTIIVKVNDLPKYSKVRVSVLCDMCKEQTMSVVYENYKSVVGKSGTYVCKDCAHKKVKETVQKKYNVDYVSQFEDFKKKSEETMMKKYNVKHALQNDYFKNRAMETTKKRYGFVNAMQSPEIRQKVNETLCKNGIRKTSIQQLYLHSLYGGEINYPIKYYAGDICLLDEKICVEYDGGFHDGAVKIGQLTKEEFNQREIVRNNIIKREGYKQIHIISRQDYLPSDKVLLQLLSYSKQYFSNTYHTWINWDIDNSKMINAENKDTDGVFFDYGELRTIKKSDIQEETILSKESA